MRSVVSLLALVVVAGCSSSDGNGAAPASSPAPPSSAPDASAPAVCAVPSLDLAIGTEDLEIYPPYAASGCGLLYVAATGDLVLRDLASGAEETVAPSSSRPRRPSISSSLVVWEATSGGKDVVRVRRREGGAARTLEAHAATREPRVSGASVVYTTFATTAARADSDVWLLESPEAEPRLVLGGAGQQRFAEISADRIAVSDFSEDPDGTFDDSETDLADIVVVDRATWTTTRRRAPGKQAFPLLLDGDLLGYLSWTSGRPEPKLLSYDLRVGAVSADPVGDRLVAHVEQAVARWVRPTATRGAIEWVERGETGSRLLRAAADGSSPSATVPGIDGLFLYAPSASEAFTLVGTAPSLGGAPKLRAVPR